MGKTLGRTTKDTEAASWERNLARRLIAAQNGSAQAADTLLSRLLEEKRSREERGLNHWPEHAPKAAWRILRSLIREDRRKAEYAAYFNANLEDLRAFARSFLIRDEEIDEALAETFIRLLKGKTQPKYVYRTLKQLALNRRKRSGLERRLFESLEARLAASRAPHRLRPAYSSRMEELAADSGAERDPLAILMEREEQEETERLVEQAKRDPRWRFLKRKKWARPLL